MSSPSQPSSGSEPQPAQSEPAPDKSGMDAAADVEIQRRFNELRRELLDHRVKLADWWLSAMAGFLTLVAVLLTFFGIVAAIVGYLSFQEFSDIETEARQHMEVAEKHAIRAESVVKEIEATSGEAQALLKGITAETVRNNPDKASEVVETVQQSPVASPIDRAVAAAISLQQKGAIEQAIEKWRSIANVAEGVDSQLQARAWFSIGYLYSEEDNWKAEIDAYDKALQLRPDMAEAYNNRGVAKKNLGQPEAALADYDKALELNPDMVEAYNNRGNVKKNLGQPEAALADLNEAIRLRPNYAIAYSGRGNVKYDLGQPDEALADYNEAIRLDPDFASAYNGRGNVKYDLGQPEAALADYNEAIRLDPDFVSAYNNRGFTKRKLGLLKEAREDYQKALTLAQKSGSEEFIAKVQRNLSQLDNDKAP